MLTPPQPHPQDWADFNSFPLSVCVTGALLDCSSAEPFSQYIPY